MYYVSLRQNRRIMEATVRKSTKPAMRRKVIDIKPDTFRGLSVYRYLQQTDPEGMEMLSEDEQAAFEKKYGL